MKYSKLEKMETVRENVLNGYYDVALHDMQDDRRKYANDKKKLMREFHKDLAILHGLEEHPKESLLFSIAVGDGSKSKEEIYLEYSKYANLLK